MAWIRKHKIASQKQGQVISAQDLRHAGETLDWLSNIQASPPLEILPTANGPLFRYPGMLFETYIAVATTTITARSGSTPGSGTVKYETWNGTALADLGGPVTVTVYSISPAPIPSGTYCVILKIDGNFWAIAAAPSVLWCVLGSSIAAGTYPPSGAPGGPLTGQTIYYISSGAYVALSGTYSVYNPRAATATSGKLAAVTPNGDGTYSVIDWDC